MKTKDVIVTYGPGDDGRVSLDKLNQMIADEKGISVSELAVKDDKLKEKKPNKKANAKETPKN
jgi:hypothetical protein